MRIRLRRLGLTATALAVVPALASCAASPSARVESVAAVGAGAHAVPGTEVSLALPAGFALDERAQTAACTDAAACGDTTLFVAWRTASAGRDPAELFAEEVEGQLRAGHSLTNLRIDGVDAVRLDAAPATVNPGEIMRDYRLRIGARTVRFHLEGHDDRPDAFAALGRAVETAVLLPAVAPIDRGWSIDGAAGLQVQESSPDYAFVGVGDRPGGDEPGLSIAYGCYANPGDATAGDDRHRELTAQLLRGEGVEVTSTAMTQVDGLPAVEAEGTMVGQGNATGRWSVLVFRADRPLVVSADLSTAPGAAPLGNLRAVIAGLHMTGPASATGCT